MKQKILSRKSLLMLIDAIIVLSGYVIAYLVTLNSEALVEYIPHFKQSFLMLLAIYVAVFYFMKIYGQMWRYADAAEYQLCSVSSLIGGGLFSLFSEMAGFNIPIRIQAATPLIIMFLIILSRIIYKGTRQVLCRKQNKIKSGNKKEVRLAIVGAGDSGVQLLREIRNNSKLNYEPVCFIDDNIHKIGRSILGVDIYGPIQNVADIVECNNIEKIIIAIPSASAEETKRIAELCTETKCKVKILPGIPSILLQNNKLGAKTDLFNKLRNIDVEDLLARDSIKVNDGDIKNYIKDKTVLVTGGGGSIGSELCRQAVIYGAKKLIILDNYENNAYDIEQELKREYGFEPQVEVITVRELGSLDKFFRSYLDLHPPIDVVFHAAAHKHVPLMEHNPEQAIKNNILGTYNVAKMCDKYKIPKMVLISTDKAVNPTNVMGATKRACEMVVQAMNQKSKNTVYAAVRFGNVLGSNGSVIPLFKKQIEMGGPITVTHEEIIRYFMTIPEAVSLVLNAGAMAKGGEIFVLDMGSPVKILDLAKNMIRLSGLEPDKDIKIEFTGLRPGEKLFEELLMAEEGLEKTESQKIFIGNPINIKVEKVFEWLDDVEKNVNSYTNGTGVAKLKELVDTYKTKEEIDDMVG